MEGRMEEGGRGWDVEEKERGVVWVDFQPLNVNKKYFFSTFNSE